MYRDLTKRLSSNYNHVTALSALAVLAVAVGFGAGTGAWGASGGWQQDVSQVTDAASDAWIFLSRQVAGSLAI